MYQNTKLRITTPRSLPGLGLSICPGKVDPHAGSGPCARDLREDVQAIRDWGAAMVVTLMERHELRQLQVADLGREVEAAGMAWRFWEIIDGSPMVPAGGSTEADPWKAGCAELLRVLGTGRKVYVHCRGGLGRTGTLAARLLIETGLSPEMAIKEVREARPGAIETREQEEYLRTKVWVHG